MDMVSNSPETLLLEDLKTTYEADPTQFCFFIPFSKIDLEEEIWFEYIGKAMQSVSKTDQPRLYTCHNGDLFFMMRSMSANAFQSLLHGMAKRYKIDELKTLSRAFLLEEKYKTLQDVIKKIRQQHQQALAEQNKIVGSDIKLNARLVQTLHERRKRNSIKNVLVIDDDQLSRTLVDNVLSQDYAVSYAKDGHTGVQSYVSEAPDIMFLDIGLPDMNGHDVLRTIFQIDPKAYIVMFSSRNDEKNVLKAVEIGAQGYVTKPFTKEKLVRYIEKSPFVEGKQNAS